jgi:hypothetical protein
MISQEVKPLEPLIKGVPTKFVVFGGAVYVANLSSISRYSGGSWSNQSKPNGDIRDLAATTGCLYVLTDSSLYQWPTSGGGWTKITGLSGYPQTIYGAGTILFVSLWNGDGDSKDHKDQKDTFAIYSVADGSTAGVLVKSGTALLTGAVESGGISYLSTYGDGIYILASLTTPLVGSEDKKIVGLIAVASHVYAVARNGDILKADTSPVPTVVSTGKYMNGAIALWEGGGDGFPPSDKLLLLGIQSDKDNTYGYWEIKLNSAGDLPPIPLLNEPGVETVTSVHNKDKYEATIGSYPVNHLFQVPAAIDPAKTLFAALQGTGKLKHDRDGGVWSYRERDGDWQWNAEQ